jgi:hypothetical protein
LGAARAVVFPDRATKPSEWSVCICRYQVWGTHQAVSQKIPPRCAFRLALHLAACMPPGFVWRTAVCNGLLCVPAHPQGGVFCRGAPSFEAARGGKEHPPRYAFGLRSTSRPACCSDSPGTTAARNGLLCVPAHPQGWICLQLLGCRYRVRGNDEN